MVETAAASLQKSKGHSSLSRRLLNHRIIPLKLAWHFHVSISRVVSYTQFPNLHPTSHTRQRFDLIRAKHRYRTDLNMTTNLLLQPMPPSCWNKKVFGYNYEGISCYCFTACILCQVAAYCQGYEALVGERDCLLMTFLANQSLRYLHAIVFQLEG